MVFYHTKILLRSTLQSALFSLTMPPCYDLRSSRATALHPIRGTQLVEFNEQLLHKHVAKQRKRGFSTWFDASGASSRKKGTMLILL